VAEAAARRGASPETGKGILAVLSQLPGWAKAMGGSALISGGVGSVLGGSVLGGGLPGAAAGAGAAAIQQQLARQGMRRTAGAAMQPPSLSTPGAIPGALGVGVGGTAGQAAGLDLITGAGRSVPGFATFMPPGLLNYQPPASAQGLLNPAR
jgi:hypothetical protein